MRIIRSFKEDASCLENMEKALGIMACAYRNQGKVMSCGNGGSLCDALHVTEELTGRFREDRPPLAALALADPAHLSCVANDYGYKWVFSRAVEALGRPGDVLLALSTSGNSPNMLEAVRVAKLKEIKSIGLLGKGGGKLAGMVDVPLIIDSTRSERIQEMHMKILHLFVEGLEKELFSER